MQRCVSVYLLDIHSGQERRERIREVTSGFLVLRLLFCEEASESDNVCIDLLLRYEEQSRRSLEP